MQAACTAKRKTEYSKLRVLPPIRFPTEARRLSNLSPKAEGRVLETQGVTPHLASNEWPALPTLPPMTAPETTFARWESCTSARNQGALSSVRGRFYDPRNGSSIRQGIRTPSITASHAEWSASCLAGLVGQLVTSDLLPRERVSFLRLGGGWPSPVYSSNVRQTRLELAL